MKIEIGPYSTEDTKQALENFLRRSTMSLILGATAELNSDGEAVITATLVMDEELVAQLDLS